MEIQGDIVETKGDIMETMVIHVACMRPRPPLIQGPMRIKKLDF